MDFKLNQDGDLILNELNEIETIEDVNDIIKQNLVVYLNTQRGSNIFYPDRGVPWFEFSGMKESESIAESLTRSALNKHEMVEEVENVDASLEDRTMNIECRIRSTEDTVLTILLEE